MQIVAMSDRVDNVTSDEIDARARRAFKFFLPDNWTTIKQTPDEEHLDYRVHIKDHGQPTGLTFFVQVKGVEKPKYSKKFDQVSFSFKQKHVDFWVDTSPLPVFLVVVDVTTLTCFWRSVEEWAETPTRREQQRKAKSVTIHFPPENTLTDVVALERAAMESIRLHRERHPSSIEASGKAVIATLKEKDPRFAYKVEVTESGSRWRAEPIEDVKVTMAAENAVVNAKLAEAIDSGAATTFGPGELRFNDDGIFEFLADMAAKRGVVLIAETKPIEFAMSVSIEDSSGRQLASVAGIRGVLEGGRRDRRFKAALAKLFLLKGEIRLDYHRRQTVGRLSAEFSCAGWAGQPLQSLAYFDDIHRLFLEAKHASALKLQLHLDDSSHTVPIAKSVYDDLVTTVGTEIQLLKQARELTERLGVNPRFPEPGDPADIGPDGIRAMWAAAQPEGLREPAAGIALKATFVLDTDPSGVWHKTLEPHALFRTTHQEPAILFGAESETHCFERVFTNFKLSDACREALRSEISQGQRVTLEMVPSETATIVTHLVRRDAWFFSPS